MKKGKEVIIGIVFLLLVPLAFSIDTDNTGWWLNPAETLFIGVYSDDDLCRSITNTHASKVLFVPTKNIEGWQSFIYNAPDYVTLEDDVVDCAGDCFGSAVIDDCGTCDSDSSNDCVQDCAGEWGGSAVIDACGVCDGPGTTPTDGCGYYQEGFPFISFNGQCLTTESFDEICIDAGYSVGAGWRIGSNSIGDYYEDWTIPADGEKYSLDWWGYIDACSWSGFNWNAEIGDYSEDNEDGQFIWMSCDQGNPQCSDEDACNYDTFAVPPWTSCSPTWNIDICGCDYDSCVD